MECSPNDRGRKHNVSHFATPKPLLATSHHPSQNESQNPTSPSHTHTLAEKHFQRTVFIIKPLPNNLLHPQTTHTTKPSLLVSQDHPHSHPPKTLNPLQDHSSAPPTRRPRLPIQLDIRRTDGVGRWKRTHALAGGTGERSQLQTESFLIDGWERG